MGHHGGLDGDEGEECDEGGMREKKRERRGGSGGGGATG